MKFNIDILEYYKNLAERWNIFSPFVKENTDRRTNEYKAYDGFYNTLIYMWDMIKQTQEEYKERLQAQARRIQTLEAELKKWTDQQTGRKPVLSNGQKRQIFEWKTESVSNREMARRLNVSEGTIRNVLKEKSR